MKKNVILYVDDEEINLKMFELNFKKSFEVFTAQSPLDALDILNKHKNINIVVSDMKMPHLNGIEFIRKARLKFSEVKYFLLTGYEISDEITAALEEGLIVKYFQKPCKCEDLKKEIQ